MDIVIEPNPILHKQAKPVTLFNNELKKTVDEMRQTMHDNRGMGLAAPQVNISLRLAIVEYIPTNEDDEAVPFMTLVNPTVAWSSSKKVVMTEGCLSVPGFEGDVSRSKRVKVKAQDINGNFVTIKSSGLSARIIQHEIDHLNGILFIEKLVDGSTLRKIGDKTIKE